jgi:hypothetical protein
MPAVSDLDGLGRAGAGPLGVSSGAVAADDLDARMFTEPFLHGCGFAVGQQVDDPSPFQINDDRAIVLSLAEGPVIDADIAGRWGRLVGSTLDAAEQGIGAGRHIQTFGQTATGLAAQGEADDAVGVGQAGGGAGMGLEQLGESLAEDVLSASEFGTAEAAYEETQSEDATVAGQIGDGTSVVTMDAVGRCATTRTSGRGGGRDEQSHDDSRSQDEVVEADAAVLREGIEEEGHGR